MALTFQVEGKDKKTSARAGKMILPHGEVLTPCFMPVGTLGVVKTMSPEDLQTIGARIILSNAYHLYLRPGMDVIVKAGGLHRFMGWDRCLLTDSGGFQIFSLARLAKVTDDGVSFQSHLDGSSHFLTPEDVMEIQQTLGSDIIMPLDVCNAYPVSPGQAEASLKITLDWAERSRRSCGQNSAQSLFVIVQGSVYRDLRELSAREMTGMGFEGYAVGGLSVGEPAEIMLQVLEWTLPLLPEDKPRYLMGLGSPEELWGAVERGIDMFDCVMPTRNARNGTLFTSTGKLLIKNAEFAYDLGPLDPECRCYTCTHFTRSYLRYLFQAGEMLCLRLLTLHNLTYMIDLMDLMRKSILLNGFSEAKHTFLDKMQQRRT